MPFGKNHGTAEYLAKYEEHNFPFIRRLKKNSLSIIMQKAATIAFGYLFFFFFLILKLISRKSFGLTDAQRSVTKYQQA